MPKYKIYQTSYIGDRVIEAGTVVNAHERHIPGPHWEPLDAEAKAVAKKHNIKFSEDVLSPVDTLPILGGPALGPGQTLHDLSQPIPGAGPAKVDPDALI